MKTDLKCTACDGRLKHLEGQMFTCVACGGIQGTCYLGDKSKYVLPYWDTEKDVQPEDLRYYDIETLGSKGIERTHGWINKRTKCIVQTG